MENKELSRKCREQIAEETVRYLKNRLSLKQRIIKGNENCITLNDFMEHLKRGNYVSVVTLRSTLAESVDYIVLSKVELDEILKYVRESIVEYGLKDEFSFDDNGFMRDVLGRLENALLERKSARSSNKLERIAMYRGFFSLGENVGFDKRFSGRIVRNDKTTFAIFSHKVKPVCCFLDDEENVVLDDALAKETIAVSRELYFGFSYTLDENGRERSAFSVFQERVVSNYRYMKAILNDGEEFDISQNGRPNTVHVIGSFKDVLDRQELSWMYRDVYDINGIVRVVLAYNNHLILGKEGIKALEQAAEVASEYWATAKDGGSPLNNFLASVGSKFGIRRSQVPEVSEENIQKFKWILKKQIMMQLLIDPEGEVALYTDGFICKMLETCAKVAEVDLAFPKKKIMKVSVGKVTLTSLGHMRENVLFDASNKDFNDGSNGSKKHIKTPN